MGLSLARPDLQGDSRNYGSDCSEQDSGLLSILSWSFPVGFPHPQDPLSAVEPPTP